MTKKTFTYNGIYRAKVLSTDVDETDNLGRVKVEVYPMLIGEATALTMINSSLQGILSGSVVYNPYLCAGMIVKFQSDRFNIPLSLASLDGVRHQYSFGECTTSLDGVEVW